MKLKYFIDSEEKKVYTLDVKTPRKEKIRDAHYKFVKIRDAPKSDAKFFRKK
jgi:hypothetical protein